MPQARGWYTDRTGARYVHVPLAGGKRKSVRLACDTDEAADLRAPWVREIASVLLAAGQPADALDWATKAAEGDDEKAKKILTFARGFAKGEEKKAHGKGDGLATFRSVGRSWTSGELARKHPDQVASKRTVDDDVSRLEWLYEDGGIGDVPIAAFSVDHADGAMQKLDGKLRSATRRQYAQVIRRVLELAVWPLRLLSANPLPRGFLPKVRQDRALQCLYPDEETQFLGCVDLPLVARVTCGFLARMGFRKSEAIGGEPDEDEEPAPPLSWDRVDLERGVVYMARSKTEKPRPIAMPADVVSALTKWRKMRPTHTLVFGDGEDNALALEARDYRELLKRAGVRRAELHATGQRDSVAVRVHDLRALFVTVSIAQGKPDSWVRDRTAHKTITMLDRYRRQARMFEELNLGPLADLDEAIPELRDPVGDTSDEPPEGDPSGSIDTSIDRGNSSEAIPSHTSAQHLGSAAERYRGSTPLPCTIKRLSSIRRWPPPPPLGLRCGR